MSKRTMMLILIQQQSTPKICISQQEEAHHCGTFPQQLLSQPRIAASRPVVTICTQHTNDNEGAFGARASTHMLNMSPPTDCIQELFNSRQQNLSVPMAIPYSAAC
eukprot:GHUV01024223.1.p2 GENE.GHUV01024223.1~~GHUV01024223.1.p2  ORF type:complete len:106 (+),score=23.72 GHUV01024223.1:338-655(+)